MSNFTSIPTFQELITKRINEKSLSRSKLVQAIGYTNVSKGIRRLDAYVATFTAPNDGFVERLLNILEIDGLSFHNALMRSMDQLYRKADRKAKECFSPYLEFSVEINLNPRGACMFRQRYCLQQLPSEIQTLPFHEELDFVLSAYREKFQHLLSEMPSQTDKEFVDIGFTCHRHYDSSLEFNAAGVLIKTVEIRAVQLEITPPAGNRVFNFLAGGFI